jgi:hypothetical protein
MEVVVPHRAELSSDISDLLKCPSSEGPKVRDSDSYVSLASPTIRFPIENGIGRAFVSHDVSRNDVTVDMRRFYNANPFPNYEEMETTGSLIEKSLARGFW